jgi:hypothetical protein
MAYNSDSLGVWDRETARDSENQEDPADNNRWLGPIIGIDLGTSNSCVSLWHTVKNRAKVMKNFSSKSKIHDIESDYSALFQPFLCYID